MQNRLPLALALACAAALGPWLGCSNKPQPPLRAGSSASAAVSDLPEPAALLAELCVPHPDATFRALRELGSPLASLLPNGFPLLTANLLGMPPLVADSFDPDLPVVGSLLQSATGDPSWVVAVHVLSGPEILAKLSTGDHPPFRVVRSSTELQALRPSDPASQRSIALAVLDNYLLVASSSEVLLSAGPYTARMLPRRPVASVPVALRFSRHALGSQIVPALRGLWAAYRTRLARLDATDRSAHAGRAPDFADPAQVILGADTQVESLLTLLDGAAALEFDLEPTANRLDATLLLEPTAGSDVQTRLLALGTGDARALLELPAETEFALGLWRTAEAREAAGQAAGEDWVRLLGARLSARDASEVRAALSDWELGRGGLTRYGFLGGADPGAFLITDVADGARLKRVGPGLLGLLALQGVRAPLAEYLGQPRVSEQIAPPDALPQALRKRLSFAPRPGAGSPLPPLSFAWLVDGSKGFAGASKNADATLKIVVQSARGEHDTLASTVKISDAVRRMADQVALFAYADARLLAGERDASGVPSPILLSLGKRAQDGFLRLELTQAAVNSLLHAELGL